MPQCYHVLNLISSYSLCGPCYNRRIVCVSVTCYYVRRNGDFIDTICLFHACTNCRLRSSMFLNTPEIYRPVLFCEKTAKTFNKRLRRPFFAVPFTSSSPTLQAIPPRKTFAHGCSSMYIQKLPIFNSNRRWSTESKTPVESGLHTSIAFCSPSLLVATSKKLSSLANTIGP